MMPLHRGGAGPRGPKQILLSGMSGYDRHGSPVASGLRDETAAWGGSWLRVAIELSDFDSDELAAAWGQNIQRPSSDSDSDLVADFHPSLNGSCHEPCCLWGPE